MSTREVWSTLLRWTPQSNQADRSIAAIDPGYYEAMMYGQALVLRRQESLSFSIKQKGLLSVTEVIRGLNQRD